MYPIQVQNTDMREYDDNRRSNGGLFVSGLLFGVALTIFVAGCSFGVYKVVKGDMEDKQSISQDAGVSTTANQKIALLKETINNYFYLDEVSDEDLDNGMYKGLVEALDDPYSEYYTTDELNDLMSSTEGIYYGIGAYVSLDTKTSLPKISGVIAATPAEAADLRADDIIYEVDGTSTYGLSLSEAVALIKGEEGTEVTLTIVREGEDDYLYKTVKRARVESPTVEYEMLDEDTAYIRITEFDVVTTDQFADALATVRGSGMKGLILDLRGNPGGNLNTVVSIARMLLPEGMIVYTEDKEGNRSEYTCDGSRQLNVPFVVLIDSNSASASEILSGAIKDYGTGTLVGTTTFGKGIVQQVIPFSDGSAVKITVSAYYTPNGNNIHGIGIEPDIECEFDGETYYSSEDHYDNQLEKAKEVLWEKMGK